MHLPALSLPEAVNFPPNPGEATDWIALTPATPLQTTEGALPADWLCPGDQLRLLDGTLTLMQRTAILHAGDVVHLWPGALPDLAPTDPITLLPQQTLCLTGPNGQVLEVPAHRLPVSAGISHHAPPAPIRMILLGFGRQAQIEVAGLEIQTLASGSTTRQVA